MLIFAILPLIFAIYVACPFVVYYSKRIRNSCLFAHRLNLPHPWLHNLKDPAYFGIENAKNVTLSVATGSINLWCIEPSSTPFIRENRESVVLYCHGNSCNRAMNHRLGLYKKLTSFGLNVVTFDYRGYGDSTGILPDENSVVTDAKAMLEWVEEHFKNHDVIIWGHSLGTGISVKMLSGLKGCSDRVQKLVLESPFLNSGEAGRHIPIARVFDLLPFTKGVIGDAMEGMFPTDELISKISIPIIILHAEDDNILPILHSMKLYEVCRTKNMTNVSLKVFGEGAHKFLYQNKEAMETAAQFIQNTL